jgi:hypothetical protein
MQHKIGQLRTKVLQHILTHARKFALTSYPNVLVNCTVGDWVDVTSDYSPGVCSEGGTGVVIAMTEGKAKRVNRMPPVPSMPYLLIFRVSYRQVYLRASDCQR